MGSKPNTPNNRDQLDEDSLFTGIELKPAKMEVSDHGRNMDYDDSKIDDDLDKLLQHIKEDQQNSLDAPDSPKEDALGSHGVHEGLESKSSSNPSRHLLYTTHFPLPQVRFKINFFQMFKSVFQSNETMFNFCRMSRAANMIVTSDTCFCTVLVEYATTPDTV